MAMDTAEMLFIIKEKLKQSVDICTHTRVSVWEVPIVTKQLNKTVPDIYTCGLQHNALSIGL